MSAPRLLRAIEERTREIDAFIETVHRPVRAFMRRHPVLRAALDGSWLGHPLHPAIIPIPIGAWTTGLVLDIAGIFGVPGISRAADIAHGVGLATAVAAASTGLAEWSSLDGSPRRVAFAHASSNLIAAALFGGSLLMRMVELRASGIALSVLAFGVVGLGAWIGGELSYHYGVGVGRVSSERRGREGSS
ncbi:DUF2231 domain-containing protein [Polyangium aurulentum]|uniref:DUF2231 domain-containing protein n=1 Tax=Polyangium aurulentum TaxID=2567896 RepID=UPI0010AE7176|nr:DUF2231 domain-containing protein [Polyangium aurulentum]UQA62809.1 DUF2231 domain-containing protein [Polyangium aurulentum]